MLQEQYVELAELAGGFIHEIKNHLSTLGLNLQLLAEDFGEPQSQRDRRALERIQRLQSECNRLVQVSNDFLRFARVKDLELAPCRLAEVIEEMVDFFGPTAKQANIEIKTFVPADLPPVPLDRDLFKQALLNLMLNAEQAMPGGGQLTIQAAVERGSVRECETGSMRECESEKGIRSGALTLPLSHSLTLSLIDTGKGMSADVLANVFRPFFSTKPGGSGLGLPTVKKIVEAHGGTIEVQSEPDRGTKFTIRLPAS
jgi:signal transduction histidine kinase